MSRNRKKNIQKEKMYECFLRAFELAEIPCEHHSINNRPYLKPGRAWYKKLGDQVLENYEHDKQALPLNYPQYLKNYFEKLLRELGNDLIEEIGYYEKEMKPLFAYAEKVKVKQQSLEFGEPVLLRKKRFRIWELWRSCNVGRLSMTQDFLIHLSETGRTIISRNCQMETVQMKPFSGTWLKLTDQKETIYLAISDGLGNLNVPDPLRSLVTAEFIQNQ